MSLDFILSISGVKLKLNIILTILYSGVVKKSNLKKSKIHWLPPNKLLNSSWKLLFQNLKLFTARCPPNLTIFQDFCLFNVKNRNLIPFSSEQTSFFRKCPHHFPIVKVTRTWHLKTRQFRNVYKTKKRKLKKKSVTLHFHSSSHRVSFRHSSTNDGSLNIPTFLLYKLLLFIKLPRTTRTTTTSSYERRRREKVCGKIFFFCSTFYYWIKREEMEPF